MKSLFHAFPKTLGENFFHTVPRVSIMVSPRGTILRICPMTHGSAMSFDGRIEQEFRHLPLYQ
jgi:hypothetical protein